MYKPRAVWYGSTQTKGYDMALNDWNTRMPDTREVNTIANTMGDMGFDVHTAIIKLDNGGWVLELQYSDEDMQDGMKEFELGNYGAVLPI